MSNEINQAFKNTASDVYNVANDIGLLYLQPELSDLTLVVNESRFPVHKVILAARCQYFRALLYGGLRESFEDEIKLQEDTSDEAVEHILKFIYRGSINVSEMNDRLILDTLSLAHKYGLSSIERQISAHLADGLCMNNVVTVLNIAVLYEIKSLITTCLRYLDKNAMEILDSDQMVRLSEHALIRLVSRDSFCAPETAIFAAVRDWLLETQQSKQSAQHILDKTVRLELMPLDALLGSVRESGLVEPNRILDAIKTTCTDSKTGCETSNVAHRGLVLPEEDLARSHWGFRVIAGTIGPNCTNYSDQCANEWDESVPVLSNSAKPQLSGGSPGTGTLSSGSSSCIIVKLGSPSKLNKVCLQLPEQSPRDTGPYRISSSTTACPSITLPSTSSGSSNANDCCCCCWLGGYTLEVSMDMCSWKLLVDYRRFCCRSWQTIYFESQVVQYLRIRGCRQHSNSGGGQSSGSITSSSSSLIVHAIKCMYTDGVAGRTSVGGGGGGGEGLLMPGYNVCLQEHHALVVEGVSRTRNSLVNGDSQNYNWDTGYTCHQLGNGAIVVQLPQPYWINCIRFLLWDLDDRVYSYTVEVSIDRAKWSMVADKSMDMCSSVQSLFFSARAVVFIRIIGTYNSVNEVFHVVHIEANYVDTEDDVQQHQEPKTLQPPPPSTTTTDIVTATNTVAGDNGFHDMRLVPNTRAGSSVQVNPGSSDPGSLLCPHTMTVDLASSQPLFPPNLPGNQQQQQQQQQQRSPSTTNNASNPQHTDDNDDDTDVNNTDEEDDAARDCDERNSSS